MKTQKQGMKRNIDINTASIKEVAKLNRIGDKLARRIIENRPFYSKDELLQVKGIGPKIFENIKDQIQEIQNIKQDKTFGRKACSTQDTQDNENSEEEPVDVLETTFVSKSIKDSGRTEISGNILLATWNIRHLSKNKCMDDLYKVCEVIEEFDIVALQEVRDTLVLKRMRCLLPGWDFICSDPLENKGNSIAQRTRSRTEIYAFFYKKATVQTIGLPWLIYDPACVFKRVPYVAEFKFSWGSGNVSNFVLVNSHVVYGDVSKRTTEIDEIKFAMKDIQLLYGENAKVVLLGDFNMSPNVANVGLTPMIKPPYGTTIFNNLYDNVCLSPPCMSQVVGTGICRIDWRFFPETQWLPYDSTKATFCRRMCNAQVSDHCPVYVVLEKEN